MKDPGSEHSTHNLNARLLRFRSQPGAEDAYALAEDLLAAKRYADARSVVVGAQPGGAEDGALLVLEGRTYLSERDLVRAQAALLRAVRAAPELAEAYRWLGDVLLKRGDPQRASKTLQRALELDPSDGATRALAARAAQLSRSAVDDETADLDAHAPPTAAPAGAAMSRPVPPERRARAPVEEEPTSRFRRLSGRPDGRATARGGSGLVPAVVKPAIPGPPNDPELGRYSAQNITAEQFVQPRPRSSGRAPGGASQPLPTRRAGTPSTGAADARPGPARAENSASLHARSGPGGSRRAGPPLEPPPAQAGRRSPSLDSLQRGSGRPSASRVPSQPTAAESHAPAPRRRSPPPASAAPLPTWDEEDGVALAELSQPLAADRPAPPSSDEPADADTALELVRRFGLFEEGTTANVQWAASSEVETRGTRVRNALIGLWVVTLLACAGGWFGWQKLVEHRHAKAAAWVRDARALMLRGDHAGLVDAERLLRLAREQHPASPEIPLEALVLQIQRVLEDGERDLAALKVALGRAPHTTDGKAAQAAGRAVVAAFGPDRDLRDRLLEEALATGANDARRLHLLGRLEERLGREKAREHIERASQIEPKLVPARLALAALALDAGDRADALQRVEAVLADHPQHLRALLLRSFVRADDADPAQLATALNELGEAMKLAGPVDRLLFELARARVSRRRAELAEAATAIERAAVTTVDDPRLLGWVAREALALNKPALAQQAAGRALSVAPDVASYRRLLAHVLVERGDGARARELLEKLPADDIEAQTMKAQAALLEGSESALRAGVEALSGVPSDAPESEVVIGALKVRLESKLSPSKAVVDRARALVRSAPGHPDALLALAEAALAAQEPAIATGALKQRLAVAPDDPETHLLLGRARRMAADAEAAEASFRKALSLAPGGGQALLALGSLLLDQGRFEEADAVFQELASRGGSAIQGRLGRVEALANLGKTNDAQVQLEAIPEAQRSGAAYRVAAARVALARGKPGEALASLRPAVESDGKQPALLALYGDALLAAEQLESAGTAYEEALDLDPRLPEALLGRAEVLLRGGRAKDAIPVLEAAKVALADRIRPPGMRAAQLVLLGRAYLLRDKRGDAELARKTLHRAAEADGAPPAAHFWLAESAGSRTDAGARAAYRRYLELAPSGKYADRARRALGL